MGLRAHTLHLGRGKTLDKKRCCFTQQIRLPFFSGKIFSRLRLFLYLYSIFRLHSRTLARPSFANEAQEMLRNPAQEVRMPQYMQEELGLEVFPYSRQFRYLARASRVLGTGRVRPALTDIDIPQALQSHGLIWSRLGQGMHIFVGCLRTPYWDTRPVCKQTNTPVDLCSYPIAAEQAPPPDPKVSNA